MFSFYLPGKYEKTSGLLMFSGEMKRERWREMGWSLCVFYMKSLSADPDCISTFRQKIKIFGSNKNVHNIARTL